MAGIPLKIDFLESGPGETILIRFPNGKVGIVDAHPSPSRTRSPLSKLVKGAPIAFACLSHPHADHGVDLVSLFEDRNCEVNSFWHTLTHVGQFFYGLEEIDIFPGPHREFIREQQKKWADFLIDLYHAVRARGIEVRQLRNDAKDIQVGDVSVSVLSPGQKAQNDFVETYQKRLEKKTKLVPDPNLLSAILAIRHGSSLVLLGSDALRKSWHEAARVFRELDLPKAVVVKVPHHGAKNALCVRPKKHESNYFRLCQTHPKPIAVLFPGDSRHPHPTVHEKLIDKTDLRVVGASGGRLAANPLRLHLPEACSAEVPATGASVVSVEISDDGSVTVLEEGMGQALNDPHA